MRKKIKIFDSHFHIIDARFPLIPNQGFLPEIYPRDAYLEQTKSFDFQGGALVSGSFQGFDQSYLIETLQELGPNYVGVTQLPVSVSDEEILKLDAAGIRAVRFNLKRGGSEGIEHLERMAKRVHELAGWHVELYLDSQQLPEMSALIARLPAASIDHLGLSNKGFQELLKLAEGGVHIKATGFGRVDFNVKHALQEICSANPNVLMFGTDLPSTRAFRPYQEDDLHLILEMFDDATTKKILSQNALAFYRLQI